ncbi:unnamed protein product [Haemonchus placei]|uniref:Uncharacterized protein n=1 Tax=Haemonchus placei TaxID=6290 RepID=A0A0N4VW03_HAEPC|nr:unnamed protein product [Haemonchus placei]
MILPLITEYSAGGKKHWTELDEEFGKLRPATSVNGINSRYKVKKSLSRTKKVVNSGETQYLKPVSLCLAGSFDKVPATAHVSRIASRFT